MGEGSHTLQTAEDRWERLAHHSREVLVIVGLDGEVRYVDPAISSVLGWPDVAPHELRGLDLVHPEDVARALEAWAAVADVPGGERRTTYRARHSDGSWRWLEVVMVNLVDDPIVGGVAIYHVDITQRLEAAAALARSEERFRSLLSHAYDAVVLSTEDGTITWASEPVERLLGDEPQHLVGTTLLDRIHPDDRGLVVRQFRKVLEAPDLMSRSEARVSHRDGGYRWYEAVWVNALDHPAVGAVVANLRDVTDRVLTEQALRRSEARLEHRANHDELTGLPNRSHLLRVADGAATGGGRVALAVFDLDHFKWVNDSRGHDVGDLLLVEVGRRLAAAARPGDVVARFGGDEFAVLCTGLPSEVAARVEAERLRRAVAGACDLGGAEVFVSVSGGLAIAPPAVVDPYELVRDADSAMYEAKARGRDRLDVFDAGMRARAVRRVEVEGWLRRAVANHELRLHLQPVIDLRTGHITGAEALVRWQHPTQGLLLPGAFIEVAEQTGLVVSIDRWVVGEASRVAAAWPSRYGGTESVSVGVNLSARQFGERDLVGRLGELIRAGGLPPERVHVEITERVVMDDVETSIAVLGALRDLGVRLAVDDFGTGYSSLSYLRRLPLDILKVDRAFVRGIGRDGTDAAIVETVVGLAHRLGLVVVAEGVEDESQLEALRRMDCDQAQGFFLSRPVPVEEFQTLLAVDPSW